MVLGLRPRASSKLYLTCRKQKNLNINIIVPVNETITLRESQGGIRVNMRLSEVHED